jgi:hypothetical protein
MPALPFPDCPATHAATGAVPAKDHQTAKPTATFTRAIFQASRFSRSHSLCDWIGSDRQRLRSEFRSTQRDALNLCGHSVLHWTDPLGHCHGHLCNLASKQMNSPWVTRRDAATYLSCSISTIDKLRVADGPHHITGKIRSKLVTSFSKTPQVRLNREDVYTLLPPPAGWTAEPEDE